MDVNQLIEEKIPGPETGIELRTGICGLCGGNGRVCVKCAALKQAVHHPDRLRYPMKRTGKRGEGEFERIGWDEALDALSARILHFYETVKKSCCKIAETICCSQAGH